MPASDRQYRRLHQSPSIPYAWAREAARRLDLGRVDRASMERLPVGLIKDGGPGKVENQEHIPDALWSFRAERSDLVMLAFEFQRQDQWYFALRLALYLFVHIVSLCESRKLTRESGIPIFVMAVTYTGERQWTLSDGNELWTETARRHMAMPAFPVLYYDVRHCETQDLPHVAELRIMMEGERRLQRPTEAVQELARELQTLNDLESREVLTRFLAEFAELWPRYIELEDGRRELIDVDWGSVKTVEEFAMAAKVYSNALSGVREEGFQQGIKQGIEQGIEQGIRQAALKILETILKQDQMASLESAWRQADWFPDLDAVLAVRDGIRNWTSLFPTETSMSENGQHHD